MNRHQRRANAKLHNRSADRSASSLLELGFECHKAGKFAEAEGYYRQVLAIEKNHPDATQLIGSIAYQTQRYDVAAEWIGRALKLNGNNSAWFSNLGLVQERLGKLEEALASHDKALEIRPDNSEALNNRGNVLVALGRADEALTSYAKALALAPENADALNNCGNVLHKLNRLDEALANYERALQLRPRHADVLNNRGIVLKAMNRVDEAIASYDGAVACNPDFFEALNNRGVALAEHGRRDEALSSYDKALALRPSSAPALTNRGNLLAETGRADEALADYDKALTVAPDFVDAVNGRGGALQKLGHLDEAEAMVRHAILLRPDYAEAYCNLGTIQLDLGRLPEAEVMFRRAIEFKPGNIFALCNLVKVLIDRGAFEEAEIISRRAVGLHPDRAEAHFNLGAALIKLGRPGEAEAASREAIALKPDLAGAHHNLGLALMELGRLAEAREAAMRAVALAPEDPLSFRQLGELRKYIAGDSYITALETLSRDAASLDLRKQIDLHFALAKAYADIGRPEDEFRQLLAGNGLKRSHVEYDEALTLAQINLARQVFSSEFVGARRNIGEPSAKPIFIVGMPRSGTTLIEQILASHPQVFGAGELNYFDRTIRDIGCALPEAAAYPDMALRLSDDHFREMGSRYLSRIQPLAPEAPYITDKMPANFLFLGLIHLALPNATIIHAVRDPVDTCISCFSRLFTEGNFQTYDLAELGRYYRLYADLMAHWHDVLPSGRVLDVKYEDTVADLEGVARRIVSHCGLPWDERCLDFHRTERVVRTSSATQVRRPIYATSVDRWKVYEPMLGPLLAELHSHASAAGDGNTEPPADMVNKSLTTAAAQ